MYLLASLLVLAPALASASTFDISVGHHERLEFLPSQVAAHVGDKLTFHFWPKNHSVAVSSFDKPCVPIDADGGLFSGFRPSTSYNSTAFEVTVNDTKPIWIYSSQEKECQEGMAMVVNQASVEESLDAYKIAARKVDTAESPSRIAGGIFKTVTSYTEVKPTSTASSTPYSDEAGRTGVGMGMIGAVGAVAVGVFAACMV